MTDAATLAARDTVPRACPLCRSTESRVELRAQDVTHWTAREFFTVVRCGCELVFLNPIPRDLTPFYPEHYGPHQGADRSDRSDRLPRWFRRFAGLRPGRHLDVGCGSGAFLPPIQRLGWKITGLEPNAQAVEAGRARGLDIRHGTLDTVDLPEGSFDLISILHVLEHVPDPVDMVARIRRLLSPRGILFAEVPNYDSMISRLFRESWSALEVPRHVTFFTGDTLRRCIVAGGLTPVSLHWQIRVNHLSQSLSFLFGRKVRLGPTRSMVRGAMRFLNGWRNGDALQIIARR